MTEKRKPGRPKGRRFGSRIALRVGTDTLGALDKEAERLSRELGIRINRTDVVRLAINRYLEHV